MLRKPCRKLAFLDTRKQEAYSKSGHKLNGENKIKCWSAVPLLLNGPFYSARKLILSQKISMTLYHPHKGSDAPSSCLPGTLITPEAARPKWIKVAQKSSASCANIQALARYRDPACLAAQLCPGTQQAEVVGF